MNNNYEINEDMRRVMKRLFSGGGLTTVVVVVIGIAVLIGAFSSFYTVETEGQAVVTRFGKVVAVKEPGLKWKLPFGIDKQYFVPTRRVLKEEFGFRTVEPSRRSRYSKTEETSQESLMLTGDLNVIDVEWVVQYRIVDPVKFLYQVREQKESIRDIAEAVMRRIVGNRLGSDVLTVGRVEIATDAKTEMQRILQNYELGISIETVELQDVTPPESVKPAFNEVNEARQQRERLINEAEKYRNQVIPKAEGEAAQTVAEAEAYRAQRVNRARGEASRYTAILQEYVKAKDVTRQRLFLEMIDEVLPKLGKIFVIDSNQNTPLPLLNLNDDFLRAQNNKTTTK